MVNMQTIQLSVSWSIMQMARNVGTSDATFDSAAQEHHNTSGSATFSSCLQHWMSLCPENQMNV